jgi:hypothetical protein
MSFQLSYFWTSTKGCHWHRLSTYRHKHTETSAFSYCKQSTAKEAKDFLILHPFSHQDERNYCVAESTDLRFVIEITLWIPIGYVRHTKQRILTNLQACSYILFDKRYHICLFRNRRVVGKVEHVSDMVFFWKDVLGNVQVLLCSFTLTDTKDGWSRQASFAKRKK